MYSIVFISTHMISKESLDRLNNLDNVLIVEQMVLAHPHRLVLGTGSPHKCIPERFLNGQYSKLFLT